MEKYPQHSTKRNTNNLSMSRNNSVRSSEWETEQLIQEHIESIETKKSIIQSINLPLDINVQALKGTDFEVTFISDLETKNQVTTHSTKELSLFKNIEIMNSQLLNNITTLKFQYMTPIQKVVIPFLLQGKDVMAASETGSGKTVAYLFPIISNILKEKTQSSSDKLNDQAYPSTMILVPTRELAEQVANESKKLCYKTELKTVAVYGGASIEKQEMALAVGCDILVGTPGRIADFLQRRIINLSLSQTIIIDEADRMLEMNFEDQLTEILTKFQLSDKDKRQNILFSATFNSDVEQIAKKFLNDYYKIRPLVSNPKKIKQELIQAEDHEKNDKLFKCLQGIKDSAIVFLDTKRGVDLLMEYLVSKQFNVVSIHGDKNQYERQNALKTFGNGTNQMLIATDVASRGIDFPNVKYVFNYDLPRNFDDYIHRIGRTGRMGQEGTAISFINKSNHKIFNKLYAFLKSQNQPIPKWFFTMNLNHQKGQNQRGGQENYSRNNRFNSNYHSNSSYNNDKSYRSRNKSKSKSPSHERSRSRNERYFRK